jgi:hypothetical protein
MAAGSAYTPIITYTITGATSFTNISLDSIPQTYTDLILVIRSSVTNAGYSDSDIRMRVNGSGSDIYSETRLTWNGAPGGSRLTYYQNYMGGNTGSGGSLNVYQFLNYTNTTTYKTILSRANNSYGGNMRVSAGLVRSTSAITSISMDLNFSFNNDWSVGSTLCLYGITAA